MLQNNQASLYWENSPYGFSVLCCFQILYRLMQYFSEWFFKKFIISVYNHFKHPFHVL